jgi:hypothetical protein
MTVPGAAPLDLDAIRARCEVATDGPWTTEGEVARIESGEPGAWGDPVVDVVYLGHGASELHLSEEDAEFIAAARTDVPALIAEVERLRALLDGRHG